MILPDTTGLKRLTELFKIIVHGHGAANTLEVISLLVWFVLVQQRVPKCQSHAIETMEASYTLGDSRIGPHGTLTFYS